MEYFNDASFENMLKISPDNIQKVTQDYIRRMTEMANYYTMTTLSEDAKVINYPNPNSVLMNTLNLKDKKEILGIIDRANHEIREIWQRQFIALSRKLKIFFP